MLDSGVPEWSVTAVSPYTLGDEYLTLAQLTLYSKISERQLRNYLSLPPGQALPCYRPGRKVLVRRREFDTWLAQYRARGKPILTRVLRELGLDPEHLPDTRALRVLRGRPEHTAEPVSPHIVYRVPQPSETDHSTGQAMGAATITASYVKHGKKWRVLIRPANAPRITRVVRTEQDAKDLVRHFNRLGMAGVDLGQALAEAKTQTHPVYPRLREAVPAFLEEQVELGTSARAPPAPTRTA